MTAYERRQAIVELLVSRKRETLDNLAFELNTSKSSICRDIEVLSLSYPIYTQSGKGGGIYIDSDYSFGKQYLTCEQQAMLTKLLPSLDSKEQKIMREILKKFGRGCR